MEITVNHKKFNLDEVCSIEHMLSNVLKVNAKGVAVAVNQNVIAKSTWPLHVLKHGDQVLLIKATQGG
jgi:sulfur carrier protein